MSEIHFTPTYEDLLAGQLLLNGKAMKRFLPWTLLIFLMAVSTTIIDYGFSEPARFIYDLIPFSLILLAAWVVLRKIAIPRNAKKMMRLQKSLSHPIHMCWTSEALSVTAKNGNSTTPLADYACWLADEKVILLFGSQALFYFYPRRAFPDEATWESLKAAVTAAGVPNHWPPK